MDFVNEGYNLHRYSGVVERENVSVRYFSAEIAESGSYEMTAAKLKERTVKCAMENNVFKSLPDDSLLDDL